MTLIQSPELTIFPPESEPMGLSYREWCKKWCEWILSIPKPANPTYDDSGFLAYSSQNNPRVIFLCQTYESVPLVPTRKVNIPKNTNIFMPIINWIDALPNKTNLRGDLKKLAKMKIDEVVKLRILVNGKPIDLDLQKFRAQSPVFDTELPRNNIFNMTPGRASVFADGYWIFFQPSVKSLSLETYGACRLGKTEIAVNYLLNSQPTL